MKIEGGVRMTQSTIEEMKQIESAVVEVKDQYQKKINESYESIAERLSKAAEQYDLETKQLIDSAQKYFDERETEAKAKLADNVARNKQQLESALQDKKDMLINQIVTKVVEEYGN